MKLWISKKQYLRAPSLLKLPGLTMTEVSLCKTGRLENLQPLVSRPEW